MKHSRMVRVVVVKLGGALPTWALVWWIGGRASTITISAANHISDYHH